MSHCVNTQAVHLWDQIWCRAQVKWVCWPQARLTPIVILKQNHKSFAGSRNQRPGAETARVLQVRRKTQAGNYYSWVSSLASAHVTNQSFSSINTNIHSDFMTSLCLPNLTSIFSTTFHETSSYLSPYHSVNSNNSNFIVTVKRSLIFRMLLALSKIMELVCSSEF